jgi:hypothetical protein
MAVYQREETYYHWITFRDRTKALHDPSSVSITITNPCGTVKVDAQGMTNDAPGVYYYPYDIPVDGVYGEWDVKVIAIDGTDTTIFPDKMYLLPWDAVDQVRELSGITSKKSVSDDTIARIIWEAYGETLDKVYELRKNETFLCNPNDGSWIDGTNKIFAVKNPPIADYNGDGAITGADGTTCDSDITLLWKDVNGDCHKGKVTVNESECGKITLTQDDDSALPANLIWAKVTYHTEWYTFKLELLRKAVAYLAAYECLIRFTELDKTTQADLNPNVIKFNVRRKTLDAKYKKILRLIKKPIVGSSMLPGK